MNQRIQELADEAAKFSAIMALPTGESGDKLFVAKFAELIVRECIGVIGDENYTMLTGKAYCTQLKRHFGVEE